MKVPGERGGRLRSRLAILAAVVLLVAVLGRLGGAWGAGPVVVRGETIPGRLFLEGTAQARLWIAKPHRSLPALLATGGTVPTESRLAWLDQALGGLRFGSFVIPPARELAVAVDDGEVVASLRFGAVSAKAAQLAGVLAGNDALRGGEVQVRGRSLRTEWADSTWTVATARGVATERPAPVDVLRSSSQEFPLALGWLALAPEAMAELRGMAGVGEPAASVNGYWQLAPQAGGLRLRPAQLVDNQVELVNFSWDNTSVWTEGVAVTVHQVREAGRRVLVLLAPEGPVRQGEIRLPSSGAKVWGEASLPKLPAVHWLEDLGVLAIERECGSGRCLGIDRRGFEAVAQWPDGRPNGSTGLQRTTILIDTAHLARFADHLASGLEGLLLVPKKDVDRARQWFDLARALESFSRIEIQIHGGHSEARFDSDRFVDTPEAFP